MKMLVVLMVVLVVGYFGYQSVSKTIGDQGIRQAELQEKSVVTQLQNNINYHVPTMIKLNEACVTINGTDFKFFSPIKIIVQKSDLNRDIVLIDSSGNFADQASGKTEGSDWILFQINDSKVVLNMVIDTSTREVVLKRPAVQ
ncbi:MAG: hypothetical protein WCP79_13780 [Bacillota bacterium]